MEGDSHQCSFYGALLEGGLDQRIYGLSTAAPLLENQIVSSSQILCMCLDSITLKVMYEVKQHSRHSNICNKVETPVHSTGGNHSTIDN